MGDLAGFTEFMKEYNKADHGSSGGTKVENKIVIFGDNSVYAVLIVAILIYLWMYGPKIAHEGFAAAPVCGNSIRQPLQAYPYALPNYYANPQIMPFAYPTLPYKHQYTDNLAQQFVAERMGYGNQRY